MAYAKPTLHSAVSIAIVRAARGSSPASRFVAEPKKTQHGATVAPTKSADDGMSLKIDTLSKMLTLSSATSSTAPTAELASSSCRPARS